MVTSSKRYIEQSATAERLRELWMRIARMCHYTLDAIRGDAIARGRDFVACVVAHVLGVDYSDVMVIERNAAKQGLFLYLYGAHARVICNTHDVVIIEALR